MADKRERALVIIKPDGVQRGLIGEVIRRYERTGLKLVGLKMVIADPDFIERHYLIDPNQRTKMGNKAIESYRRKGKIPPPGTAEELGEIVLQGLKKYMTTGPVVVMVWQGTNAVEMIKKITGSTEPLTSDVGTIRGDLTIDSYEVADIDGRPVRNLVHISGTPEEAEKEIVHWFTEGELLNYRLVGEAILYDVNLDGILE